MKVTLKLDKFEFKGVSSEKAFNNGRAMQCRD